MLLLNEMRDSERDEGARIKYKRGNHFGRNERTYNIIIDYDDNHGRRRKEEEEADRERGPKTKGPVGFHSFVLSVRRLSRV